MRAPVSRYVCDGQKNEIELVVPVNALTSSRVMLPGALLDVAFEVSTPNTLPLPLRRTNVA